MRASTFFIVLLFTSFLYGQSKQNDRIKASFVDMDLEVILDSLSAQSGYFFSYNSNVLPKGSRYTITAENEPIDQFLSRLLMGTGLKYSFYRDQIILNYEAPRPVKRNKVLFTISGKVSDENGESLPSVNVFLDGTSIGTFTDIDGNYKLEGIPAGFYDIVFSHVGYENAVYHISEQNGGARIQRHQMEVDLGELEEVSVVSSRIRNNQTSWQVHYQTFLEELLGTSVNASNCTIENPEVLNFHFDEENNELTAFASGPLLIRNDALGYRINYLLESFRKQGDDLRYRGKISFRNLEPLSKSEARIWRKNRKSSFNGSFNHFKRALIASDLRKEGFRIYALKNLDKFQIKNENQLEEKDVLIFLGDHYKIDFKNYLIIEFRKEEESIDFLLDSEFTSLLYGKYISPEGELVKNPGNQISILRLLKGSLKLDLNGQILDKFAMTTYGYWSWERLADLVPVNYDPNWDNL